MTKFALEKMNRLMINTCVMAALSWEALLWK